MGEYSKPKVTIDLEEYQDLVDFKNSEGENLENIILKHMIAKAPEKRCGSDFMNFMLETADKLKIKVSIMSNIHIPEVVDSVDFRRRL